MTELPSPQPLPPPQIPEHHTTIQERFKRAPKWAQALIIGAVVALIVGALAVSWTPKKDDPPTARDQRIEAMRVTWNGLSAKQQFDICASVHNDGVDVAADQVQEAAGDFSADTHADIVFFLGDVACT